MRRDAIVIKKADNVATAIRDIPAGREATVGVEDERIVILAPGGMYFGPAVIGRARAALLAHLQAEGGITVGQFGQVTGATRKYSIPLLQYFNHANGALWAAERQKRQNDRLKQLAEAKQARIEKAKQERLAAQAARKSQSAATPAAATEE